MSLESLRAILESRKWIAAALMTSLLFAGCEEKNVYAPPPPPQVAVSKPIQQAVTDYADFNGLTQAIEYVEIRARVEGYLESINFQPGSRVKEGDLLFVIDPRPFQAKLDEAKAELERRKAELKQAEATLKRKELAYKANAVSEVEVIQGRADRDVAKAAIQAALAAIDTAELNLAYTRIHAPISGRIGRDLVDEGNLVGASERTLLTTIVKDDPIYAYFNVNERDLLYYQQHTARRDSPTNGEGSTPVYLGLSNQQDYPFEGRIDFVDNRLDPSTGTIQVRGVFPNSDHRLWPGLFARIRVPIGTRDNALLVPDPAIGTDQRGEYLLVVNDQNMVEYRPVQIGAQVLGMRVIETGIAAADRIIVEGLQRARPDSTVSPVPAAGQESSPETPAANPKRGS